MQYCYREVFNIELPRTTYYQCEVGVEVPFEELLPGDLLFFADGGDVHHVAMYLGDGYYVEAPHTGRRGEDHGHERQAARFREARRGRAGASI